MTGSRRISGFSLIELMVVVLVIGVLAAIALPQYQRHVVNTRRAAAAACLMEFSQFAERYYNNGMTYAGVGLAIPDLGCETELANFYTFAFTGTPDATSYGVMATAINSQATRDTLCGNLSLTQTGARSESGTASSAQECW